ncbi:chaperone modulator CbpM [Micromonospora sp. NPDC048930]|uniref:chaperone modulator CbpM n=1 Tax=Micromonospora sp. NPDC048930 TaxID=3364261 RepID=UPI0037103C4D
MSRYALVRRAASVGLTVEQFAAAAGLHPGMVSRMVALGLLDADPGPAGAALLPVGQVARAARIVRLRAGLGLNYTAVGVVLDLLDRIEELEAALRARPTGYRR